MSFFSIFGLFIWPQLCRERDRKNTILFHHSSAAPLPESSDEKPDTARRFFLRGPEARAGDHWNESAERAPFRATPPPPPPGLHHQAETIQRFKLPWVTPLCPNRYFFLMMQPGGRGPAGCGSWFCLMMRLSARKRT